MSTTSTTTAATAPPPAGDGAGRRAWLGRAARGRGGPGPARPGPARGTLAGAVDAAHRLPDRAATDLLRAAHDACTGGPHVAGIAGAVAFAGLAVCFLRVHRRSRRG
ncbi:hypothetical protein [Kitasatospora sp. NPDC088548]|uniref:hypothetical protein n=1 Tax=Kitasatospora sp. NPDC088548 TaxID=3364075 RepID=UPI0037F3279E